MILNTMLRPYQQDALDSAIRWAKKSIDPACMELATGAGKSWILAYIAKWINDNAKKQVLILQPSAELVKQNFSKYTHTGERASIYSASAGEKCINHPAIFATPMTVANNIKLFGDKIGAVLIDECHQITPTIKSIIEHIRKRNKYLRVIGVSATPFRLGSGYIYQYDTDGRFVEEAREPYFSNLLYRITTQELIDQGYLTPAHADIADGYDASGLQTNSRGQFNAAEVEQVFEGRGRLTSQIVADVVAKSVGRMGVMIFAATVDHACEIMESLPHDNARMLGGVINMQKAQREKLVNDFKAKRYKYIVSVGTLTTGVDFTHVDVIAVLRATESPGLFQQIIGRGLRLHPDKSDCLVLDYAGNVERHGLQDDLFTPEIKVKGDAGGGGEIKAICPECGYKNEFAARPNPDEFSHDDAGYFIDLAGCRVEGDDGPIPAHMGRRCYGQVKGHIAGTLERCGYRWTSKECPECGHQNDIAARYCERCRAEIIDPNEKLQIEYARIKRDPYTPTVDMVESIDYTKTISQAGNETLRIDITTDCRFFSLWINPTGGVRSWHAWEALCRAVYRGHVAPDIDTFMAHLDKATKPKTVTAYRQRGTKFYRVIAWNQEE